MKKYKDCYKKGLCFFLHILNLEKVKLLDIFDKPFTVLIIKKRMKSSIKADL